MFLLCAFVCKKQQVSNFELTWFFCCRFVKMEEIWDLQTNITWSTILIYTHNSIINKETWHAASQIFSNPFYIHQSLWDSKAYSDHCQTAVDSRFYLFAKQRIHKLSTSQGARVMPTHAICHTYCHRVCAMILNWWIQGICAFKYNCSCYLTAWVLRGK